MDTVYFLSAVILLLTAFTSAINHGLIFEPPSTDQQQQLNKVTDALIGAEDFAGWANMLSSSADPSSLPMTATLFVPSNDAISRLHSPSDRPTGISVDSFLIPYHIVPQRLTFSDLQNFSIHTRLPTLLPGKFIVVTNNSVGNFSVDGSRITHPDLFVTGSFSVHGVMDVLDYSVFGTGEIVADPPVVNSTVVEPKPKPNSTDNACAASSDATGFRREFLVVVSVVCIVLAYNGVKSV